VVVGLDLLLHVVVLVLDVHGDDVAAILAVDEVGALLYHLLLALEQFEVVVADDVLDVGLLDHPRELGDVDESVIALGVLGSLPYGEHVVELGRDKYCIEHLVLGVARVDVAALDVQLGGRGVEVLVLEFADGASVHGVGVFGTELSHVEMVYPAADFLVGGEADLDGTVLEFRMFHDVLGGGHDFGHSGLVVGSEQGVAVGGD